MTILFKSVDKPFWLQPTRQGRHIEKGPRVQPSAVDAQPLRAGTPATLRGYFNLQTDMGYKPRSWRGKDAGVKRGFFSSDPAQETMIHNQRMECTKHSMSVHSTSKKTAVSHPDRSHCMRVSRQVFKVSNTGELKASIYATSNKARIQHQVL